VGAEHHPAAVLHRWRPEASGPVFDCREHGHDWRDLGVEWCVVGLDRNWAYNTAYKMARPLQPLVAT
jgi:hypothetical protein